MYECSMRVTSTHVSTYTYVRAAYTCKCSPYGVLSTRFICKCSTFLLRGCGCFNVSENLIKTSLLRTRQMHRETTNTA